LKLDILHAVNAEREARRAVVVVTHVDTGEQRVVRANEVARDPLHELIEKRLRMAKSGMEETPQGRVFLTVHVPSARLVITGAVHISQALAPIAILLGYDVVIIDPRTAFATPARFPGVDISHDWPDEALEKAPLGPRSAVVFLSHDPKIDDPGLVAALKSNCFYIGTLGSKKTQAARQARMKAAGFGDNVLARIHGPVGLDIGARSPAEIAVSILAEMTLALRGRKADARPA